MLSVKLSSSSIIDQKFVFMLKNASEVFPDRPEAVGEFKD